MIPKYVGQSKGLQVPRVNENNLSLIYSPHQNVAERTELVEHSPQLTSPTKGSSLRLGFIGAQWFYFTSILLITSDIKFWCENIKLHNT